MRVPPAEFSGRFWLPASGLEIAQDWEPADDNLRVGDSLDWTLTIVARGLPAESLPQDLLTTASGDFRIYADKPTRSNRFDGRQMIGRVEQRYAVIASRPGVIELPAVTLKWWDVHNDREQQARLEAKTIQVIAAAGPTQADWSASALLSALTAEGTSSIWLLTVLSLLAGVIVAFRCLGSRCAAWFELLLQRRRREHRLRRCCRANDARGARAALLDWGRQRWPGEALNGLYQIGDRVSSRELRAQLAALDAALYSRAETAWRGQPLWRLIAAEIRRGSMQPKAPHNELPRLYPLSPG